MIENLVRATAYNLIAIPVAAGVFEVRRGYDVTGHCRCGDEHETIIVAANAQLLRRLDLRSGRAADD